MLIVKKKVYSEEIFSDSIYMQFKIPYISVKSFIEKRNIKRHNWDHYKASVLNDCHVHTALTLKQFILVKFKACPGKARVRVLHT